MNRRSSPSSAEREAARRRWRAFLLPHWPHLVAAVLTLEEGKVLSLRLGIANDVGLTQNAIARRFDCSSSRIAQLERSAIAQIRVALKVEEPHETA